MAKNSTSIKPNVAEIKLQIALKKLFNTTTRPGNKEHRLIENIMQAIAHYSMHNVDGALIKQFLSDNLVKVDENIDLSYFVYTDIILEPPQKKRKYTHKGLGKFPKHNPTKLLKG